jgi:peptidoglycan/xylan/chitin deacetylase (PgdA/CDA1 family)
LEGVNIILKQGIWYCYRIIKCLIVIWAVLTKINLAQINSSYQVGTWQGFRSAAISYTFDDGTANQFTTAIPMFDEYGFKLTLFTVINWSSGNWTKLQAAANNGHEIGSHTNTHPHLGQLTNDQQTVEELNSRNTIDSRIIGQKCLTLAYPYCETGNLSICKQYYIAARICSGQLVSNSSSDYYNISSIICGSQGSIKTAQDFNNKANSALNSKGWVVYLLHGIDNESDGYSPVNKDELRGSLDYLKENKDKFWVTSFVNVVLYSKERKCVSVTETSASDTSFTCQVTDTLDNSIYNFPITIRRQLPEAWSSAVVKQGDITISSQIVEINSKKFVMFDVIPDNGDIIISGTSSTGINSSDATSLLTPMLFQNYPNPFNPSTVISYQLTINSFVTLKVYNTLGQEIEILVNEYQNTGFHSSLFTLNSSLPGGIYFYQLRVSDPTGKAGNYSETKKLILVK